MKNKSKLPLILVIALPILLIISTEVSDISFNFMGQTIYLITFIYPITFFISVLISKRTESKIAMNLVILALIMQCFVFVLKWVLLGTVNYVLMEITFLALLFSQLVLLFGYEILKEREKTKKYIYVLIIFLISTLIETLFYISIFREITGISLLLMITIKIIYDLIFSKLLIK